MKWVMQCSKTRDFGSIAGTLVRRSKVKSVKIQEIHFLGAPLHKTGETLSGGFFFFILYLRQKSAPEKNTLLPDLASLGSLCCWE